MFLELYLLFFFNCFFYYLIRIIVNISMINKNVGAGEKN